MDRRSLLTLFGLTAAAGGTVAAVARPAPTQEDEPIAYRDEKGSPLTAREFDSNLRELERRIEELRKR